jgi:T5orf172 domain-containing protein
MNTCEKCNIEFKSVRNLNLHINKKIPCDRIIKCNNCLKIFKLLSHLTNHLNRKNKCIKIDFEKEIKELKHNKEILELTYKNEILELKLENDKLKLNKEIIKLYESKQHLNIEVNNSIIKTIKIINELGIIYLLQPAELVGINRFKIGISNANNLKRCNSYKNGTRYLCIFECNNPLKLEQIIKNEFNKIFNLIAGKEYFEGNENEIKKLFIQLFINYTFEKLIK